jgi:peptidoglycan/xylan/chitin deacetylase (PgdA/CDA1 family)
VSDIVTNARPGSIILAHDVGAGNRKPGLQHLYEIIAGLKARGFKLVTVSELLAMRRTTAA